MKRNKVKCEKCDREISKSNILRHKKSCTGEIINHIKQYEIREGKYICNICGKVYTKKGIDTHIWRSHGLGKNHDPNCGYENDRTTWNKGVKTGPNKKLREGLASGRIIPSFTGKTHSKETKEKISKALSKNNHGGRCKWYQVSGVKVQGTWERDLAKHMNKLGIKWTKLKMNKDVYTYIKEESKHHYTPDFRLNDFDIILELKGYWWGDDKEKMRLVLEQNNIPNLYIIEKEKYKKLLKVSSINEFIKIIKEV